MNLKQLKFDFVSIGMLPCMVMLDSTVDQTTFVVIILSLKFLHKNISLLDGSTL